MRLAGIVFFLCRTHHEDPLSVHKKPQRTGVQAREKPNRSWEGDLRGCPA
jgi:hypothetical protein